MNPIWVVNKNFLYIDKTDTSEIGEVRYGGRFHTTFKSAQDYLLRHLNDLEAEHGAIKRQLEKELKDCNETLEALAQTIAEIQNKKEEDYENQILC